MSIQINRIQKRTAQNFKYMKGKATLARNLFFKEGRLLNIFQYFKNYFNKMY